MTSSRLARASATKVPSPAATIIRAEASSCSSSMSPTTISTRSSIETRPSVPPYSSMTRAMWVRVACIRTRRSMAGIERGTNRTGRRILAAARVIERSTWPRLGGSAVPSSDPAPAAGGAGVGAHGEEIEEVADVDHALGIVEGLAVDRQAGMAGGAEQGRRSPRVVSAATATMSARGTMTSSTRMRWKPRTFLSIARSWGEKFVILTVSARASSRSSRMDSRDFRTPKRVNRRSNQRSRTLSASRDGRAERSSRLRSSFMERVENPSGRGPRDYADEACGTTLELRMPVDMI